MRYVQALSVAAGLMSLVGATKHHLIVGTFSTSFLYTVEYDDVAETLELHNKKNLYGTDWNAEKPSFVSFGLNDAGTIGYETRVFGDSKCTGKKSVFVAASPNPPYNVYGNYFYGDAKCGAVMSVHENGSLNSVIQSYEYADGSAIQGTSFSSDFKYLYSADDGGNSVWIHSINENNGFVEYIWRSSLPSRGANPRHIVSHPGGLYVYVILEGTSEVAQLMTSSLGKLYPLKQTYPLIKDGDKASDFWADEIALSANNKYLWASNRAYDPRRKGYISVISVNEIGSLRDQLFLTQTTSSGGFANAVSPSPFNDNIAALTDNSTGFVEIWKMGDDGSGVKAVARLDIKDGGGCCANAVWYS